MEGKPLLLFHFALVPLQKRNRGGLPFCARTLGAEDGRGPTSLLKFLDQEERKPGKEHGHIHVWRCESREEMHCLSHDFHFELGTKTTEAGHKRISLFSSHDFD